jgi:hypothetical protein
MSFCLKLKALICGSPGAQVATILASFMAAIRSAE